MFSSFQQALVAKVKDQASSAREKLHSVTEKVLQDVVESEAFKKHVAFNADEHILAQLQRTSGEGVLAANDEVVEKDQPIELGEPLGTIDVFVSRVAGIKKSVRDIYVEAGVSGELKRTSTSRDQQPYDWDRKMFDWDDNKDTLTFVVHEIDASLAISIVTEGVLVEDKLIGQIVIPLKRLFPSVLEEFENLRLPIQERATAFTEGPQVYEIFPLPRGRSKFQPAVRNSAKTGLEKPSEPLGYARIWVKFTPNESLSSALWLTKAYLETRVRRKPRRTPLQNVMLDVARTQRHVQRQITRLDMVAERLLVGPFALTLALSFARSWESPFFSMSYILITSLAILYLPLYLAPIFFFINLFIGGYFARQQGEANPVVWNSEIRDPDDALNPMQRMAKLLWILETMSRALVEYADFFERVLHAFAWRDERASALMFGIVLSACIATSVLAYALSYRVLLFCMFITWVFLPFDFQDYYRRSVAMFRAGKSAQWPVQIEPLRNIFLKVPTSEELGHLYIADMQRVKNQAIIEQVERIATDDKDGASD